MICAHMEFPWWVGILLAPVRAVEWVKEKCARPRCPDCAHPEHEGVCGAAMYNSLTCTCAKELSRETVGSAG